MKKWLVCLATAAAVALGARHAEAKTVALYGSGQGGVQTRGDTGFQAGFEVGAHVLLFDAYVGYMGFGTDRSVSRAIVGLRGGLGGEHLRLVLRAGVGAIHESSGALTTALGPATLTRTGGVARAGGSLEVRLFSGGLWLGAGVDGETFGFLGNNSLGFSNHGSNLLAVGKLTFELGL
jgi:hypothetical protein